MVYLLYNIIVLAVGLLLLPYYLLRGIRYGKTRRGIRERLGYYDKALLNQLRNKRIIWVHAVSVGETRAAIPLLKAIKKEYPRHTLLLTGVTETGRAVADEIDCVDFTIFFPFDLSWAVHRALRLIKPAMVIIVETELWPNFVRLANKRNIPIVMVNGRISDRSFPRYLKARMLVKPIMEKVSRFCMQSEVDAERVRLLGAPEGRTLVSGNLKYDMPGRKPEEKHLRAWKSIYRLPDDVAIWAAGSTHQGEEEAVADVYKQLLSARSDLVLIMVPRHPERARSVASILRKKGLTCYLRSELTENSPALKTGDVLLVDTLGEVLKIYSLADVVFVGGSLVDIGGHNILEAAFLGKVSVFGPYMQNFKEISEKICACNAGIQILDAEDLFIKTLFLMNDPSLRAKMGRSGAKLLAENVGATKKSMQVIQEVLKF